MTEPEYETIRHTCLLQAAATMFCSGQIHCGQQCKDLDDIFQQIERETGMNSNKPVKILEMLWTAYRESEQGRTP